MATATIGRPTAASAKAARQKKILIGGAVLMGIVMVIQVPRTMKMLGGGESPAPAAAPLPSPLATTPVVAAAPSVADGKLVSFERFRGKDPFIQQVTPGGTAAPAAGATTPASGPATPAAGPATAPASGTTAPASGTTAGTATTSFETTPSSKPGTAGPPSATITVNGREYTVAETKTFPTADPVFKLVSIGEDSVELAIADGSLKDGGKTVTLTADEPLTLLNTADGKRYRLVLVSTSD